MAKKTSKPAPAPIEPPVICRLNGHIRVHVKGTTFTIAGHVTSVYVAVYETLTNPLPRGAQVTVTNNTYDADGINPPLEINNPCQNSPDPGKRGLRNPLNDYFVVVHHVFTDLAGGEQELVEKGRFSFSCPVNPC